jgi:glycosyltransferase involved in cell wall biosynthesis
VNSRHSVLFVLDRKHGHATRVIRGLALRESLEARGWQVGYVDRVLTTEWLGRKTYRYSEDEIVRLASSFEFVYLLKVPSVRLVRLLRQRTTAKVVFDLSDALWKPFFQRLGWDGLEWILANVDAVFCENSYIADHARPRNGVVAEVPSATHVEAFAEMRRTLPPRSHDKITIGWVGSVGTVGALKAVLDPLEELFARHSELELRIVGCDKARLLPRFRRVRYTARGEYDQPDMLREVLRMDIGIFPPPFDEEDYELRGALKAMIYMSAAVPPVCQDAGECSRLIEDGVDGMLAATDGEWLEKMETLVVSPSLRLEMGRRALINVRREHSLDRVSADLEQAFELIPG